MWSLVLLSAVAGLVSLRVFSLNRERESLVAFAGMVVALTLLLISSRLG